MNILIADDELRLRKIVSTFLKKNNYNVTEVANGEQAVSAMRAQRFDLVILDITMPIMSGLEACQVIKSDPVLKDVPIVLLTASVSAEERAKSVEIGVSGYITKPFSPKDLIDKIARLTNQ